MPNWIKKGASKNPGAFKKKAADGESTQAFGAVKADAPDKTGAARKSRLPYKTRKD